MRNLYFASIMILVIIGLSSSSCAAQSNSADLAVALAVPSAAPTSDAQPAEPPPAPSPAEGSPTLSRIGVGVHMGTLGPGADVGFRLAKRINIRGDVNYFSITETFTNKGTTYGGSIKLESGEVHLDYFLWHSLHVSPGLLFSNGNLFSGTISVPGGQSFTLNSHSYTSDPANPIAGTGQLKFNQVAPSVLFGIGDLVPRGKHRFSVRLEVGGAFRGTPTIGLNFTGSVCTGTGSEQTCQSTASDAQFQTDVASQVTKFNNDISFLKFYPILQFGVGIRL